MQTQLKISESNPLSIIAYRDSAKCVCEREREIESVCVCVLLVPNSDLQRVRLFVRTRPEVLDFGRESIDEKGMVRREERREEGDSERVEVREGGECVGSRGSLRVESGLRVF